MKHSFCGRVAFQSHVERRRLHAKRAGQIALSWTRCLPGGVRSRFLGMILSNFLFEVRLSPERTGISLPLNLRPLVPETSCQSNKPVVFRCFRPNAPFDFVPLLYPSRGRRLCTTNLKPRPPRNRKARISFRDSG